MELPNQKELQTLFSGFLFEAGLSSVSIKNYLSDLRHFFAFCSSVSLDNNPPSVQEIFQNISKYVSLYSEEQKKAFTPQNTINRRLASIRRFSTFLSSKFGLQSSVSNLNHSPKPHFSFENTDSAPVSNALPILSKILEHFKLSLAREKKTYSTIKNYISDLNHFFAWSANETPFLDQRLENILSESHLNTYITYLKLSHTSTSVINRRQSSIKKFAKYCFSQKYLPANPFEIKIEVPHLAPLSWMERLRDKRNTPKKASRHPLVLLYHRYNSLPFTPYIHLAILALATSAMVIFGYNQIIKQAPSSSAAVPTVPRRQLSFQGRLTDSSGTPIVTAVNVIFKLWNAATSGTQLYTSNTCSITPDSNGIFNTLIGNGTCGQEIASTVFTENRDVFLEVTVGSETLTPRQQIATVGYALNSETLQGYPASAAATLNTIPVVDENGDINIAAASPTINSTSGTFTLNGQAITISTTANSGGDIILQPDAIGGGQVQILGATTTTDTFRIENANLTSGSLISGYVGNDTATGNLLALTSGSTETDRFIVGVNGRTLINTNGGTDSIFSASSAGITRFTIASNGDLLATGALSGLTGLTVSSGTVSLPSGEINNTEISELDWTKLQNYPSACPAGQAIQAVGDTLTCVDISAASGNLWQRTDGSLAPLNITDSLNLGATATASALVHLAGTAAENSWINTGYFGIGDTTPSYALDVTGDINLTGALRTSGSAGTATQVLTSTGTGVSWVDTSTVGNWQRTSGSLAPKNITDSLNLGSTATSSALVHLAGTIGENSWINNSGNFGIGTVNPTVKLDIAGGLKTLGASTMSASLATNIPLTVKGTTGQSANLQEWQNSSGGTLVSIDGVGRIVSVPTRAVNAGATNAGLKTTYTVNSATSDGDQSFGNLTYIYAAGTQNYTNNVAGVGGRAYQSGSGTVTNLRGLDYGIGIIGTGGTTNGVIANLSTYGSSTGTFANLTGLSIADLGAYNSPTTMYGIKTAAMTSAVGTSKYGIYLGSISGAATNNYAIYTNTGDIAFNAANEANTQVGIGLANPAYDLDVVGDINLTGALYDNGSAGTSGQVLSTTGTGVQWIDAPTGTGGGSNWQRTSGSIAPLYITDSLNLGATATSSALVHLAGTAGENSWINTGNFGIGDTTPASLFTVGDGDLFQVNSSGAIAAVAGITNTGIITSSGGNIDLNASSNYTTNINTGTSTGAVSIGGGSNTVAIDSSSWDISTSGAVSGITTINMSGQLTSTLATGSSPFVITSTTLNENLNADLLDGQHASYFAPLSNINGTTNRLAKFTDTNSIGDASINDLGSSVAMTIDSAGQIGIGLTTPLATLDVLGSASVSGSVRFSSLSTGIVHSDSFGNLSSSAVNLANSDVTGTLPILNGGTNNTTFTSGKFLAYDGSSIVSTSYDQNSFEAALTFTNGLTRLGNTVSLGGTLTSNTDVALDGFNFTFSGTGNVGIGTATPSAKLEIAGTNSLISNSTGDLTFNAASGFIDFSGDSLKNLLNATISGQLILGNFADTSQPVALGSGSLIYSTTANAPLYYDGSAWQSFGGYFNRTSEGIIYTKNNWSDSINLFASTNDGATSSAKIRLSGDSVYNTFFMNPIAIGFNTAIDQPVGGYTFALETNGGILPQTTNVDHLGSSGHAWKDLYLTEGIYQGGTGTESISIANNILANGDWHTSGGLKVGSITNLSGSNKLEVVGDASVSATLNIGIAAVFTPQTAAPTATTRGTLYYDNTYNDLYLNTDGTSAFHRLALDMTKYSSSSASVANAASLTLAYNSAYGGGTNNDISVTGWVYNTLTSAWDNISNFTHNIIQSLQNQFDAIGNSKTRTQSRLTDVELSPSVDTGTGADGAITVSSSTNINTTSLINGRSCADGGDAVNYSVTTLTTNTAVLSTTPSTGCLVAGDEILLINLQGTSTASINTGNYETLRIASISTNTITFTTSKTKNYGDNSSDDSNLGILDGTQRVMLQRVPNYTNVTVNASQNFTPSAWDGVKGGVLFFRANGTVSVSGTINANGIGFVGGPIAVSYPYGGEAFCSQSGGGTGASYLTGADRPGTNGVCGGGGGGAHNAAPGTGSATAGGAGGGGGDMSGSTNTWYGGGGGGGGYGSFGYGGSGVTSGGNGSTNASGDGGLASGSVSGAGGGGGGTYGNTNLTTLFFGSGGGAGGGFYTSTYPPKAGANGGGIIAISANSITVSGTISANGNNGTAGGSNQGGGGGGAGGSVLLNAGTLTLGSNLVSATGGTGGSATLGSGGNGGNGRTAIYYTSSYTGSTSSPTATYTQQPYYPYGIYHSAPIETPNAVTLDKIRWEATTSAYGKITFQTRTGNSTDPTDGTWEAWKPAVDGTNYLSLQTADTHTDWTGTNATVSDGSVTRNVNQFEDEDEATAGNTTQFVNTVPASGYAEATINATDISAYDYLTAWVYATASGNTVKIGFGESAATEQEETITIDATNTWQKIYWDLSDIASTSKDAITKLRITNLTNPWNTIHFDNIKVEKVYTTSSGSNITSTPNNYIQYRAIFTTINTAFQPKLNNVTIDYNDGYKISHVDDSNSVQLYNYTGLAQQLRLDVIVFGADLAEYYGVNDQSIGPGDVVAVTGELDSYKVPILRKSNSKNDSGLLGVISTNAGQTLGIEADDRRLLALAGRVPVKIASDSAAIKYGDYLTSSNEPGKAKKATIGEKTIGTALESWSPGNGKDTVLILVGTGGFLTPAIADLNAYTLTAKVAAQNASYEITNAAGEAIENIGIFSNILAANFQAGVGVIKELTVDNLTVRDTLISPIANIDELKVINATISGTLYADNIQGQTIDALHSQINLLNDKYSTASAILANLQARYGSYNSLLNYSADASASADPLSLSPLATTSAVIPSDLALNSLSVHTLIANDLMTNGAIFTNALSSFDNELFIQPQGDKPVHLLANLMTLYPDGKVLINGDLLITGTIFAQGLDTKTASVSGSLAVGSSTIASQSANFAQLTTNGLVIASGNDPLATVSGQTNSNATIGTSTIIAGTTEISILNTKVTPTTLIYVTPTSDTKGKVLYVKSKTDGIGFTVSLAGTGNNGYDISFNYWLVETK
ncbi:MAG TPA: site-specific integrase [Candidatus Woesebacteria bacterium]|nr:site-specific integrase [Candidatus Woesebacteria bacterium]